MVNMLKLSFFLAIMTMSLSYYQNDLWAEEDQSDLKKNHMKLSFVAVLPAPYGDYELLKTNDWSIQGPIFSVQSNLKVDDSSNLNPFYIHKKLIVLQKLGKPFTDKEFDFIPERMEFSAKKILYSTLESGIYFGSHEQGFLSKIDESNASQSIVCLRSPGDIVISVGNSQS